MTTSYEIGKKLFQHTDEAGIQSVVDNLRDVAPHISRYIIEAFGQHFHNPVLSYQQREMIIIAALVSLGDTANQLKWHASYSLKVGLSPNQLIELVTHCIPFSGFPRALNAIGVLKQLFADQQIEVISEDELLPKLDERRSRGVAKLREIDGEHGIAVIDSLADTAPLLAEQIVEFTFGEIYSRQGLNAQERQLVTLAALTAQGDCQPQLHVHLNAAIRVGLTKREIVEALLQCAPYTGFPKVLNAIGVAKQVFLAQ